MVLGLSLIDFRLNLSSSGSRRCSITGNAADITDLYTFQGQETNNLVLRLTLKGC
jgi:hypothetical protein